MFSVLVGFFTDPSGFYTTNHIIPNFWKRFVQSFNKRPSYFLKCIQVEEKSETLYFILFVTYTYTPTRMYLYLSWLLMCDVMHFICFTKMVACLVYARRVKCFYYVKLILIFDFLFFFCMLVSTCVVPVCVWCNFIHTCHDMHRKVQTDEHNVSHLTFLLLYTWCLFAFENYKLE